MRTVTVIRTGPRRTVREMVRVAMVFLLSSVVPEERSAVWKTATNSDTVKIFKGMKGLTTSGLLGRSVDAERPNTLQL